MRPIVYIVLTLLLAACSKKAAEAPKSVNTLKTIPVTRAISLPAQVVSDPSKGSNVPATLSITQAAEDEPAEGPSSFDVRPDKGFVIADPVHQRVVFYDSAGRYEQDLFLSIAARHVRVLPNKSLSVVRFHTGERYIYDADAAGNYSAPRLATEGDPNPDKDDAGVARLEGAQSAIVLDIPEPGREVSPLAVRFEQPGAAMVGIRRLGTDERKQTFVLIESAAKSDTVHVKTVVRKYSRSQPVAELAGIETDPLSVPEDAFRVRDGLVCQLVPKSNEVRINVWDTGDLR